ncbi:transposase domain-containing protein, partial [Microvirga arabica]|uniref:transposase domain-containing protein n=1 Tax=Microvirga arabica TaxID=1128671 RepID=UPI00363092FE
IKAEGRRLGCMMLPPSGRQPQFSPQLHQNCVRAKLRSRLTVERAIRPLALTRKNALFAGSDHGGEHWAIIASLVETCKLCGVDPQAYLADVLSRIVTGHLNTRIDDLLPWAYATTPDLKAVA